MTQGITDPTANSHSRDPYQPPLERSIFCNRTLNMRSIAAIGYDMDYTLIHYDVEAWERCAYEAIRTRLLERGWPVEALVFDHAFVIRGLIIDTQRGNIVKTDRFGYVKKAYHGTKPMSYEQQRIAYSRTVVDLSERRWVFLNTFFSISEACMYAQLVDLRDAKLLPEQQGYADLYQSVRAVLDEAHAEGEMKAQIIQDPSQFVVQDPEIPRALLDQREAGKRLMLITNSEWSFTKAMMKYAFDPFLPPGTTWRSLFEVVIVSARKPDFFLAHSPLFEIINDDGHLLPAVNGISRSGLYLGGHAALVEQYLGVSGSRILYVGDHIYGDVHVSKSILRWRTGLVLRELEDELRAIEHFRPLQLKLSALMSQKVRLNRVISQLQLAIQRAERGHPLPTFFCAPPTADGQQPPPPTIAQLRLDLDRYRADFASLDDDLRPLALASSTLSNPRWGLLTRTGNDKSHLARHLERHADIYFSRVSSFLYESPFAYLQAGRGSLPHDADVWMPHDPPPTIDL